VAYEEFNMLFRVDREPFVAWNDYRGGIDAEQPVEEADSPLDSAAETGSKAQSKTQVRPNLSDVVFKHRVECSAGYKSGSGKEILQ
jgi:hypothetical protein